jgi:hypothetical protein
MIDAFAIRWKVITYQSLKIGHLRLQPIEARRSERLGRGVDVAAVDPLAVCRLAVIGKGAGKGLVHDAFAG